MKKIFLSTAIFLILFLFISFPNKIFANDDANTQNSTISVNTGSVPADGSSTAVITVTVKDDQNNPISNVHVTLTSTTDSGLIINSETVGSTSSTAGTDSSGVANFTVKSSNPSPSTDTFTATDTSDDPVVSLGSGSVSVTFTAAPLAPNTTCTDGAPGSIPQLTSAVSNSSNQITLTWTDATDPVSYYLLAYGNTSGQYIYGNPNIGPQGTTSYTVGSLAKGATYYFAIKAVHGCNPGSFSNEISAVAGGSLPTPIPTTTDTSSNDTGDTVQQNTDTITQDTPTDTPAPTDEITSTPAPVQTSTSDTGISKIIVYSLSFIGALSLAGIIYLWKFKK